MAAGNSLLRRLGAVPRKGDNEFLFDESAISQFIRMPITSSGHFQWHADRSSVFLDANIFVVLYRVNQEVAIRP
jgi:hypothetical protein